MSRKKNLLDYLALTLFIMCMGLALSASLEYVTRATEREYLGQGIWVLSMAGLSLLALLLGRISRKCGQKMQPLPKNIVMIALGAVLVGVGVYLRLWVIWNIPVEPDSDFETLPGSSPDRGARNAGVFRQMTSTRSRCPDFPIRRGGAA